MHALTREGHNLIFSPQDGVLNKALDIGCSVGRSSFELARSFDNVIGIDFSHAFIDRCNELKHKGSCQYVLPGEGELGADKVAKVSHDIVSLFIKFIVNREYSVISIF